MTAVDTDWLLRRGDSAEDVGDYDLARSCFEQGAAMDDEACWARLGLLFDEGCGVEIDKTRAMQCYRKAWRHSSWVAANNIAILYRERGDHRSAVAWFRRLLAAGDRSAHLKLVKCYLSGKGVRKSPDMALRHLAAACQADNLSEYESEEIEKLLEGLQPKLVEPKR